MTASDFVVLELQCEFKVVSNDIFFLASMMRNYLEVDSPHLNIDSICYTKVCLTGEKITNQVYFKTFNIL